MADAMMVNSAILAAAAAQLSETDVAYALLRNGVVVTSAQLEAAARILRDAEPCVITSPRRLASTSERPGFIHRERQAEGVLVLDVGILPSVAHRIAADGNVASSEGQR